jgi:hypothetical protein
MRQSKVRGWTSFFISYLDEADPRDMRQSKVRGWTSFFISYLDEADPRDMRQNKVRGWTCPPFSSPTWMRRTPGTCASPR